MRHRVPLKPSVVICTVVVETVARPGDRECLAWAATFEDVDATERTEVVVGNRDDVAELTTEPRCCARTSSAKSPCGR